MFRSFYHYERKKPLFEIIVAILIILSTLLLISLHVNIAEEAQKRKLVTEIKQNISSESILKTNSSSSNNSMVESEQLTRARRLPQAIIIGSRKSGTRALLKFLEVNPSVRAAHNEVHFFDKPQNFKLGFDWYKNQMPESNSNEITIEKSPAYFVTSGVPERVKAMNSSIKLVVIFRDPVTRLISDFSQLISNKIEETSDEQLEDYNDDHYTEYGMVSKNLTKYAWAKAEKKFEKYVLRPDGGIDDQRRAVKIGMYSVYLEQWRALFPAEQFHFVNGETLITSPYEELHKLELFLGLKTVIRPDHFVFNTRKGFFCLNRQSQDNINQLEHLQQVASDKQGPLNTLVKAEHTSNSTVRTASGSVKTPSSCLSKSKGRKHVAVKRDLIEDLQKFYAPYNEYLYSLTGKDFDWPRK